MLFFILVPALFTFSTISIIFSRICLHGSHKISIFFIKASPTHSLTLLHFFIRTFPSSYDTFHHHDFESIKLQTEHLFTVFCPSSFCQSRSYFFMSRWRERHMHRHTHYTNYAICLLGIMIIV